MSRSHRIDVHHHLVPPIWAEALSGHGGDPSGWHSPAWSPDSSPAFMDAQRRPDAEGAVRELEYSFDTLGVNGVVLLSNYAGHYLGDPAFGPLWAALERRAALRIRAPCPK